MSSTTTADNTEDLKLIADALKDKVFGMKHYSAGKMFTDLYNKLQTTSDGRVAVLTTEEAELQYAPAMTALRAMEKHLRANGYNDPVIIEDGGKVRIPAEVIRGIEHGLPIIRQIEEFATNPRWAAEQLGDFVGNRLNNARQFVGEHPRVAAGMAGAVMGAAVVVVANDPNYKPVVEAVINGVEQGALTVITHGVNAFNTVVDGIRVGAHNVQVGAEAIADGIGQIANHVGTQITEGVNNIHQGILDTGAHINAWGADRAAELARTGAEVNAWLADRGAELAQRGAEFQQTITNVGNAVGNFISSVVTKGKEVIEAATEYTRGNPVETVIGALGLGGMLAAVRGGRKSQERADKLETKLDDLTTKIEKLSGGEQVVDGSHNQVHEANKGKGLEQGSL